MDLGEISRRAAGPGLSVAAGASDSLRGPTFWSDSGAAWEAVIFAVAAGLWGLRILTRRRAGFLFG